jgi:hypothetical protein
MKLPPALKALLAQVIGTAAALAMARSGLLPGGLWPVAVIQALAATVVAMALGSALVALDPPGLRAPGGGGPATAHRPGWYLAAFVGFALVFWSSFRTQVPLFLSNRATAAAVATLSPGRPARLLDLGSGTGSLLRPLAQMRPDCRLEGIESAPAPYALSVCCPAGNPPLPWRGRFLRHWHDYDLVYAFLSPVPMTAVWHKASAELRPAPSSSATAFPSRALNRNSHRSGRPAPHPPLLLPPAGPAYLQKTGITVR